jgi:hypothetical protein
MSRAEKYSAARSLSRQRRGVFSRTCARCRSISDRRGAFIDGQMQQKVADVEIAMIDAAAVHAPRHLRHAPDQRALESRRWRHGAPVAAKVFEADGGCEFFGDDEGLPPCRVAATLAEGDGAHGIDAEGREPLQRAPFIAGAEHRQAAGQQVLEISRQPMPRWILA